MIWNEKIHEISTQLLQQAIKVVEFTVGIFTHQERNIYTHPSQNENEGKRNLHLLDRRI